MFGAGLRNVLAKSASNRLAAVMAGRGVTALVQSSTATALIVASLVGQGLMALPSALAAMLGADIGTSLMAVVFSRDLSWLTPLFIFVGVVLYITRASTTVGRVGRILIDIEDKKINPGHEFSEAGMVEVSDLHAHLVDNLRLGLSVFLQGNVRDAQKLLEEKARFGGLEREYVSTHLERLAVNTVQSIQTSSLYLDLISDLKRINSHICSIAYPILDSVGALAPNRLRQSVLHAHD